MLCEEWLEVVVAHLRFNDFACHALIYAPDHLVATSFGRCSSGPFRESVLAQDPPVEPHAVRAEAISRIREIPLYHQGLPYRKLSSSFRHQYHALPYAPGDLQRRWGDGTYDGTSLSSSTLLYDRSDDFLAAIDTYLA